MSPRRVGFGQVATGAEATRTVTVINRAAQPRTLLAMSVSDPRFVVSAGFTTLDPGQAGDLTVRFRPDGDGGTRGSIRLGLAGAPDARIVIGLAGSGRQTSAP